MKALEVEVAMMKEIGVRNNIVVPNVWWGLDLPYEADLVALTLSGYATEIEIKVSRSDLLKDKLKKHGHNSDLFKYFAVPEKLVELCKQEIPKRAGIYMVKEIFDYWGSYIQVEKVREAEVNKNAEKWNDADVRQELYLDMNKIKWRTI